MMCDSLDDNDAASSCLSEDQDDVLLGFSPVSVLSHLPACELRLKSQQPDTAWSSCSEAWKLHSSSAQKPRPATPRCCVKGFQKALPAARPSSCQVAPQLANFAAAPLQDAMLTLSLQTVAGCSDILGHTLEDRACVSSQQDLDLVSRLHASSAVPLRDASQRGLFVVAPLDVLVTRDGPGGRNRFHIIEINGTGFAGITNMTDSVVTAIMQAMSELPSYLPQADALIMVASSGQESTPPVSRTLHEKMLYCEALRKGFLSMGRPCQITNMSKLERDPASMPAAAGGGGPLIVLGYMTQFRRALKLSETGELRLHGRHVHAAINDRFVLNIMHQFNHQVDLTQFCGFNACFAAGADKGIAYTLYNQWVGGAADGAPLLPKHRPFACMTECVRFERAFTRDALVATVTAWLQQGTGGVVIKPQGTGCGHGIEFFFDAAEPAADIAARIDASLSGIAHTYQLACGGLPYVVCEYLDTASVHSTTSQHRHLEGHKFELRIVVYRDGGALHAVPSIAKVAPLAYDPLSVDKGSLINNITASAKASQKAGHEFMLPLANHDTLHLLGVQPEELEELCLACTHFMRHVVDQAQDAAPALATG